MWKKLLIAIAAFMPAIAHAENVSVFEGSGWTVFKDDEYRTCSLITIYTTDEMLFVQFNNVTDSADVVFTSDKGGVLGENDERNLNIVFLKGGRVDQGWKNISFKKKKLERNAFFAHLDGNDFLVDFAASSRIGFFYNDEPIEVYNLEGSAIAVKKLRECAARYGARDPFTE